MHNIISLKSRERINLVKKRNILNWKFMREKAEELPGRENQYLQISR